MLIGLIRPVESRTAEVTGASLEDIHAQLDALVPEGFALTQAPARMVKGTQQIETTGTFTRVDGIREIEAEDMGVLTAQVPDGWQLLSVQRV